MALLGTVAGGLVAGVVIGPLARLALPGKQYMSVGMTILVGAVGAIVGGLLADALGVADTDGIDWVKHGIQLVVAALVIWAYARIVRSKRELVIPER